MSTALETCGVVVTDAEVPAAPRKVDLWFMPDPTREPVPTYLGLLARLLAGPSALEFFHNTPNGNELKALEADVPERTLALPILLRLRLAIPTDPTQQTSDDQEFLMQTQDIVETWRREAVCEGIARSLIAW